METQSPSRARPLSRLAGRVIGGEWIPKSVSGLLALLVANRLGASSFGVLTVAQSVTQLAWSVVDLGVGTYGLRAVAERPIDHAAILWELLTLNLLVALAVSAVVGIGTLVVVDDTTMRATILLCLPYVVLYALYPDWYLRGRELTTPLVLGNLSVVSLWALGIFVVRNRSVPAWGLAWALSPALGVLATARTSAGAARVQRRRSLRAAWTVHLRAATPLAMAGLISNLTLPLTLWGLAASGTTAELGAFGLGVTVAALAVGALWSLSQNALPLLIRRGSRVVFDHFAMACAALGFAGAAISMTCADLFADRLGTSFGANHWWLILGLSLLAIWGVKYGLTVCLIAGRQDGARVLANTISSAVAACGAVAATLLRLPLLSVLALLLGESLGVAVTLRKWLRHRHDFSALLPALT